MRAIITFLLLPLSIGLSAQLSPIYRDAQSTRVIEKLSLQHRDSIRHFPIYPLRQDVWSAYTQVIDTEAHLGSDLRSMAARYDEGIDSTHALYTTSKKPFLKTFYKSPGHFFQLDLPDFTLRIDPILDLSYGQSSIAGQPLWRNQRGIAIRGSVDKRLFFYTRVLETQESFPQYIVDAIRLRRAIPGQGLYKGFSSDLLGVTAGYDFLNADGGITYGLSKHIDVSLGHGRHFIGSGLRSLLLSDFSDNYFYLKLCTQVWRLTYQNIYAELLPSSPLISGGNGLLPKKYMTAHYLGLQVSPRVYVGLYEAVVFSRNNQYELQYLNPLIFYRTVEQKIGSPDNVILGVDTRWDLSDKTRLYGQVMIDELIVSRLLDGNGWWGNKNGFQLGVKTYDLFGINGLSAQIEYNQVRPFTYAHRDSSASYSHTQFALAHPLGANFREGLIRLSYVPVDRLRLTATYMRADRGLDRVPSVSLGSDILKPTDLRPEEDFGYEIGVGTADLLQYVRVSATYEWRPGIYADAIYSRRSSSAASIESWFSLGLRWNQGRRLPIF